MRRKMHSAKEIAATLRRIQTLILHQPVKAAVRTVNITEVTYYRWRKRYHGLSDQQIEWLARLQADNARLCRQVADLKLDRLILEEVSREVLANPALRRRWVDHLKVKLNVSERRLCKVLGQHRSTQRKVPKRSMQMSLIDVAPAPYLRPPLSFGK